MFRGIGRPASFDGGFAATRPAWRWRLSWRLAACFIAFASYLLGNSGLAELRVLGQLPFRGFEHYDDGSSSAIAALIIGSRGLVLAIASIARPVSPIASKAVTVPIAILAVMFFWLGVWRTRLPRHATSLVGRCHIAGPGCHDPFVNVEEGAPDRLLADAARGVTKHRLMVPQLQMSVR